MIRVGGINENKEQAKDMKILGWYLEEDLKL